MGQALLPSDPSVAQGDVGFKATLGQKVSRTATPSKPRSWRIGKHRLFLVADKGNAAIFGDEIFATQLDAVVVRRDTSGTIIDEQFLDLGSGVVTNAGAALLALDYSNTTATLKLSNYHQTGTGTTAEAVGQTALVTLVATSGGTSAAVVTGTQSNPASQQYRTVATVVYTVAAPPLAITEWGLFTAAAGSGTATMWDRRVFSAINVDSSTTIQFTYTLTCQSGG